jgi:hypothetical protein
VAVSEALRRIREARDRPRDKPRGALPQSTIPAKAFADMRDVGRIRVGVSAASIMRQQFSGAGSMLGAPRMTSGLSSAARRPPQPTANRPTSRSVARPPLPNAKRPASSSGSVPVSGPPKLGGSLSGAKVASMRPPNLAEVAARMTPQRIGRVLRVVRESGGIVAGRRR